MTEIRKIYKNQSKLTIYVTVGVDITAAKSLLIKYRKPSGTLGQFTATEVDAVNGEMKYVVTSTSDIDESGDWVFWGWVKFVDDKEGAGLPVRVHIYEQGK